MHASLLGRLQILHMLLIEFQAPALVWIWLEVIILSEQLPHLGQSMLSQLGGGVYAEDHKVCGFRWVCEQGYDDIQRLIDVLAPSGRVFDCYDNQVNPLRSFRQEELRPCGVADRRWVIQSRRVPDAGFPTIAINRVASERVGTGRGQIAGLEHLTVC